MVKPTLIASITGVIVIMVVALSIIFNTSGDLLDSGNNVSAGVQDGQSDLTETFIAVEGSTSTTIQPIYTLSSDGITNTTDSVVVPATNYTFVSSTGVITWVTPLASFNNSNVTITYRQGRTDTLPLTSLFSSSGVIFILLMIFLFMAIFVFVMKKRNK